MVSIVILFTSPRVLPSIQFDDQLLFETDEIDDEFSYRLLTPEFKAFDEYDAAVAYLGWDPAIESEPLDFPGPLATRSGS